MTEAEWLACEDPEPMLEWLGRIADRRRARLYGVAVCRRIWHCLTHVESRRAVIAAEQYADGLIDEAVLKIRHKDAAAIHQMMTDADWLDERKAKVFEAVQLEPRDAAFAAQSTAAYCSGWHYWAPAIGSRAASAIAWSAMSNDIESYRVAGVAETLAQSNLVRDIFGNPFRSVAFSPACHTDTAVALARGMYESRDFYAMPILADALQDAGCDNADILSHCRSDGPHVRGCWVVDLVLGKS